MEENIRDRTVSKTLTLLEMSLNNKEEEEGRGGGGREGGGGGGGG